MGYHIAQHTNLWRKLIEYEIMPLRNVSDRSCMNIKKTFVAALGTAALSAGVAHAELALEINGDKIAASGDLVSFQYYPGQKRLDLRTFFADIRCVGLPEFTGQALALELDQVIKGPEVEPEAKYDLSGAESITYTPSSKVVSVKFPDSPDSVECTHEIPAVGATGAFWISNFDPLFKVSFDLPSEPGFDFQVQVNNNSPILPLRDIEVKFTASVETGQWFSPPSADVKAGEDPDSWVWTIPLLWPAGAMEDHMLLQVASVGVKVDEIVSLTRSSYPDLPPVAKELITVIDTSTSR